MAGFLRTLCLNVNTRLRLNGCMKNDGATHLILQRSVSGKLVAKHNFKQFSTYKPPKKFRKSPLPFEQNLDGVQTTLVFQCRKWFRKCIFISIAGTFLGGTLLNSAELMYTTLGAFKPTETKETDEYPWYYWWKYFNISVGSTSVRLGISGFMVLFGKLIYVFIRTIFSPGHVIRNKLFRNR